MMIFAQKTDRSFCVDMLKMQKLYLQLYLLNLVLNACLFYNANFPAIIQKGIGLSLMAGGSILASTNVLELLRKGGRIKVAFFSLGGLLAAMLLSGLANIQYGIVGTAKIAVWSFILFFMVFPYSFHIKKEARLKELGEIVLPALIVWGLLEIVAIFQFLFQITYFVKLPQYRAAKAQGVYYNRVFGIFVDAPMAASLSWSFLLFGLLLHSGFPEPYKVFAKISILLNGIYIVLSGSRASYVAVIVGATVYAFVYFMQKPLKGHPACACLAAVFCASSLVTGSVSVTKAVMVQAARTVNYIMTVAEDSAENNTGNHLLSDRTSGHEISLERTDLEGKPDITNLRTQIWEDSLKAYRDRPLLGVSIDGFLPYMDENYPDGFIAREHFDVGNGYLALLVYGGTVTFLAGLVFIIIQLFYLIPCFWKYLITSGDGIPLLPLFAVVSSTAVVAMINMDIFYINWANAMLFWLSLGTLNAWYLEYKLSQEYEWKEMNGL